MGGTVIETESKKLIRQGKVQMIIELGQEDGLDDAAILERLQNTLGLSLDKATDYVHQYG